VHDWLTTWGGSEQVLEGALEALGEAPIHTLVYAPERFRDTLIGKQPVVTSFLQRLPGSRRNHRRYLPLMPLAIEQFDLRPYSMVFSSSHAVSHGVLTRPDQLHVAYTHAPLRYGWHLYHQYLEESGLARGPGSWFARAVLHYLRIWDFQAAQRVDRFLANSQWTARCIWRAYRREAEVVYPPVDVDSFQPNSPREDYYVTVSRLVPYKKIGLIVRAFGKLGYPLKVVGDGPLYPTIAREAPFNVEMLGWLPKAELTQVLGRARAFVYAAEEDFGITPVEAQAAGCPVLAYGSGGALETVIGGKTGLFFQEQSEHALMETVKEFERSRNGFRDSEMRANAERFRKERFHRELRAHVDSWWTEFRLQARRRGSDSETRLES
jgi:glycosyltransferase involved in cell wall biosynthesis